MTKTHEQVLAQRRAHYAANRERLRADARRRRADNPEKERGWDRARYARSREKRLAECARYRDSLSKEERQTRGRIAREKRIEYYRAKEKGWRDSHPDEMRAFKRAWKQRNPEQAANDRALRRARQAGLPSERIDRATVYARDEGCCYLCGYFVAADDFHMDHVIPIAAGGPHLYSNVATTHAACSQKKGARLIVEGVSA